MLLHSKLFQPISRILFRPLQLTLLPQCKHNSLSNRHLLYRLHFNSSLSLTRRKLKTKSRLTFKCNSLPGNLIMQWMELKESKAYSLRNRLQFLRLLCTRHSPIFLNCWMTKVWLHQCGPSQQMSLIWVFTKIWISKLINITVKSRSLQQQPISMELRSAWLVMT